MPPIPSGLSLQCHAVLPSQQKAKALQSTWPTEGEPEGRRSDLPQYAHIRPAKLQPSNRQTHMRLNLAGHQDRAAAHRRSHAARLQQSAHRESGAPA
jgi:hypothetical protein